MEQLIIASDVKSPQVDFDPVTGLLVLTGRSIPENSYELYKPILAWMAAYVQQPAPSTVLEFKLNYFNSSSAEYILDMLRHLKKLADTGHTVACRWYFDAEDEDMQQIAQDFETILGMPIQKVIIEPAEEDEDDDDDS